MDGGRKHVEGEHVGPIQCRRGRGLHCRRVTCWGTTYYLIGSMLGWGHAETACNLQYTGLQTVPIIYLRVQSTKTIVCQTIKAQSIVMSDAEGI